LETKIHHKKSLMTGRVSVKNGETTPHQPIYSFPRKDVQNRLP
jgi:hypothetical protein